MSTTKLYDSFIVFFSGRNAEQPHFQLLRNEDFPLLYV